MQLHISGFYYKMRSFLDEFYNNKRRQHYFTGICRKNMELFPEWLGLSLSLVSNLHEREAGQDVPPHRHEFSDNFMMTP